MKQAGDSNLSSACILFGHGTLPREAVGVMDKFAVPTAISIH